MTKFTKFTAYTVLAVMLFGCSAKQGDELFNLSPNAWFSQILSDIKDSDLDNADKHFVSFASEHIASAMLEETMLILAQAHANDENYSQANYYLDEYIKRYGTTQKIEYAKFLKIKANFDSFVSPNRNQKLVKNSIDEIQNFLYQYPHTKYRPLVETMLTKFRLADHQLNVEIRDLYKRTGRDVSAEIYEEKVNASPLNDTNTIKPKTPWYRAVFE